MNKKLPKDTFIYQVKITLRGSKPPIWRRLLVPSNLTFEEFSEVIIRAMGWHGGHLHQFMIGDRRFGQFIGPNELNEDSWEEVIDEQSITLAHVVQRENEKLYYDYDFGDGWEHILLFEKILPVQEGQSYPFCVTGKRACPPEDVGGVWGYADFLKIMANPKHKEYKTWFEWAGGKFDPEEFDLDYVNQRLRAKF